MKLTRKGQMKILESIAVLLVFTFLFGFGIQFYAKLQTSAYEEQRERFSGLDAIRISSMLSNMPELTCSIQNTQQGNCIDIAKLNAWVALETDTIPTGVSAGIDDTFLRSYFQSQLGSATIEIEQLYPVATGSLGGIVTSWKIYDEVPKVMLDADKKNDVSKTVTQVPVALLDSSRRRTNLGVLVITQYGD
ncbi:MAG TPA: hypothetical protein VK158_05505 [Acidobacteriota bacterium]|nr:hypothetical protein [Acidobacteriota bacterium]